VRGAEPKLEQQKIVNQFGTILLDVIRAMNVMVPSAKSLAAPAPPAPVNPGVDHFQCYKVRVSTGASRFHKIVGVKVDDQFGTGTFDLLEPMRLCAPADKNNENRGAEAHPDHLDDIDQHDDVDHLEHHDDIDQHDDVDHHELPGHPARLQRAPHNSQRMSVLAQLFQLRRISVQHGDGILRVSARGNGFKPNGTRAAMHESRMACAQCSAGSRGRSAVRRRPPPV
jgi:hypothetical protein